MTDLWLTYGPSASGKSTWARRVAGRSGGQLVRLSMDDVRATLGKPSGDPTWSKEFEGTAFQTMLAMAKSLVAQGKDVIFDNTHLSSTMPSSVAKAFRQHRDVAFHVKDFSDVTFEECVRRDRERTGHAHVGRDVISRQFKIMRSARLGGLSFRLTEEWLNSFRLDVQPYRAVPGTPKAFIIDVDGTVTLGPHNRTPYEWHKVGQDLPRTEVIRLANLLQKDGYRMLALSGRSEVCRRRTLDWFYANKLQPDMFRMRKAGDNRSDDLVKLDLFNEHVRDSYDVRQVFDDRTQVVALWRLLGLQCNQVAPGDF